jgi:ubiquinone/menaquinone biosynthesis C-methylase UbiE
MTVLSYLSKKASRKNLYNFIYTSIQKIKKKNNKTLNIGSGGDVENELKKYFNNIYSIDIDKKRNPNQTIDICDKNFIKKIKFKPNLICIFEVLEHTKDPNLAIKNIYRLLKKNDYCLASVPFNFHIHDEPNDFYRFTYYGIKFLFKDFSQINIKERNGWLESIFIIIIRFHLKFTVAQKNKN